MKTFPPTLVVGYFDTPEESREKALKIHRAFLKSPGCNLSVKFYNPHEGEFRRDDKATAAWFAVVIESDSDDLSGADFIRRCAQVLAIAI